MSIVLVDAPSIAVALVGPVTPQSVQVAIAGLTPGQSLVVTGNAAGATWPVRGGTGSVPSEQLLLTDAAAPLNVPITYTVTLDGQPFESDSIVVPFDDGYVLQSLDGRTVIPFRWHDNADPRETHMRTRLFDVPGRSAPVVRWDVSGGEAGELLIRTEPTATETLRTHLRTKGPVLLVRTDGQLLDLDPVQYVAITRATRSVLGFDGLRLWSLSIEVITDPEPSTVLPSSTWDDFDAAYAALTWDDFDAEWAGLEWTDDFDRTDWSQR